MDQVPSASTKPLPVQADEEDDSHRLPDTPMETRSVCLVALTVMGGLICLYLAAAILLPFLAAILLMLLLSPVTSWLNTRFGVPATLASVIVMLLLAVIVAMVFYFVSVPASSWISKVPQSLPTLQERFGFLREPLERIRHGASEIEKAMQSGDGQAPAVAVQQPSNAGAVGLSILSGTKVAMGQLLTVAVTLFFLLTSGDGLLRNLVEILPRFDDKRRAVGIAQEIQRHISGYLLTITAMNLAVGVANGLAMWALGMPNPLLWGALAFLLNYVPILGPLTGVVIFFFVGLFSSPSLGFAFLPAGIYLLIHVIEGETVTPMLLARRFTLNPALVIMSLFFWDWLWGVPGAFLAVPLMATFKIICDRLPPLMPLGHLLGGARKSGPGITA